MRLVEIKGLKINIRFKCRFESNSYQVLSLIFLKDSGGIVGALSGVTIHFYLLSVKREMPTEKQWQQCWSISSRTGKGQKVIGEGQHLIFSPKDVFPYSERDRLLSPPSLHHTIYHLLPNPSIMCSTSALPSRNASPTKQGSAHK